ncbi:hypothetical protein MKX03_007553 [Papaver bracteatum]|nr:hypothetical protein MKX03_007553 [Papaver bracteatum]
MVVSIVGMGGLGKTTVATKIYKTTNTERYFDVSAWVYVSQESRVVDLLRSIIIQVTMDKYYCTKEMDEEALRKVLYNYLQERRHKRILLTTRNLEVARLADPSHENIHKMVDKCRGLPLGVLVLGGLLLIKDKTLAAWSKVHDSVNWELTHGERSYLCSGVLAFSYYDMPYYLKPCFMSIGLYPEDHEIRTSKLFHFWIAEGFVRREGGETLEDTAEDYLEELIHRSLIKIERCRYIQTFQIVNGAGYEGLLACNIKILEYVGEFVNLQTLIIKGKCTYMRNIWSLHRLRHLDIDLTYSEEHSVPSKCHLGIDNLRNLQTLSISYGFWMTNVRWDRLRMLKKFSATTFGQLRFKKEFIDSIAEVTSLRSLSLMSGKEIQIATQFSQNTSLTKLHLRGPLPEFLFPSNLVKLVLSASNRSDTGLIEVLGNLKGLKFLEFRPLSYTGTTMIFSTGLFVRLQSLEIAGFPGLSGLIIEEGALVSLTHLVIRSCGLLWELPGRIGQLQLQVLHLYNMHPRLTDKLRENVGKDWHQIEHISSVVIAQ